MSFVWYTRYKSIFRKEISNQQERAAMAHETDNTPEKNLSEKSFKDTLNLPRTEFPLRSQHSVDDPQLLERWQREHIYRATFDHNSGHSKYILHDGPPYANGTIHLGHAYNKILKDILSKSRRMAGYHVPVTPGWDCHGLPIELKVAQEHPHADPVELKKACRKYAQHWIDVQRQAFKNLGVFMDWDRPYITMDYSYEAAVVRAFSVFVQENYIERKNKTVPWCLHCKTVLATAEIEYKDRKDPSIYTLFELQHHDTERLFGVTKPISIVVWTTTPWTLPLNRAVLAHPQGIYVLLELDGQYYITGAQVADKLIELKQAQTIRKIKEFSADYITGIFVHHPFLARTVPLLFDLSVGLTEGTAFVHCAPGCGPVDYEIGVKNNLEIYSPVSPEGTYTQDIEPQELLAMPVTDGQIWVIKKLAELHKIFYKTNITHSYPHCWRCRNPLIFRATQQWFFDLDHHDLKKRALEAVEKLQFIPAQGRNFLRATVESRWEWCLSRQRVWGVPIPALLCKHCDYAYLTPELLEKAAAGIEREGIEYWDRVSITDLIGVNSREQYHCSNCSNNEFIKEKDILDVWFESGVSHYAVLYNNPALGFPADSYLEGIDQHRAWFQSSLLTSLVLEKTACMKTIISHGYTVDAKGQKMSKSLGNVVSPDDIIKQIGTDGLRLWVASIGHDSDPVVSDVLLKNVAEVYRKIRNTCRFLLSNLYDFDITRDALVHEQLLPLDQYAAAQLYLVSHDILAAYERVDFTAVFHALADYCATDLSSFYLDVVKDRLYTEKADGHERRSAQTVLWHILDTLTRLMAPVLSFAAEYLSDYYQKDKQASIHLQEFTDIAALKKLAFGTREQLFSSISPVHIGRMQSVKQVIEADQYEQEYLMAWDILKDIRSAILKALEVKRETGLIKHSLEAQVILYLDPQQPTLAPALKLLSGFERRGYDKQQFLKELLIVSQFTLADGPVDLTPATLPGVYVLVGHAAGVKCPRCWQWDTVHNADHLCRRCQRVLYTS